MDADTFRILNVILALGIVFVITVGLIVTWHYMLLWRWVLVAIVIEHCVLAYVSLDAHLDPLVPHGEHYLPARLVLLSMANTLVIAAAAMAALATFQGDRSTPDGPRRTDGPSESP